MSERKILGTNNYLTNMSVDRPHGFNEQYRTVKKGFGIQYKDIRNDKQNYELDMRQKMSEKSSSQRKALNSRQKQQDISSQIKLRNNHHQQQCQCQQLLQLRQYYKKCLKAKKQLQKRCQQLQVQNKLLSISKKSIQQLKQQNNKLHQQLTHYKSQLFNTKDKLKLKDQQYMDDVLVKRRQLQISLQISQEGNNIKVMRLQKQLQKVQIQNYHLHQQMLSLKNQLKLITIEKDQLQFIKENKTHYSISKNIYENNNRLQKQQETKMKQQYQSKLKRYLQSVNQKYQLKMINVQSQLQMEKFKYHTVNQEYKHLQSKISHLIEQIHKVKTENHQYLHINDQLNKKYLDLSFLIKQIIYKIEQLSSQQNNQTLLQYLQIVKDKVSRIQQGKNVTYLQSDTKNFLPINWRQQQTKYQTSNIYLDNLFTSLIKDTQQSQNILQNLKNQQQNQQSTLQLPQKQKRFTFNPYESSQEQIIFQKKQKTESFQQSLKKNQREEQQFENKILRERNAIQARIRAKYQSQKKVFNQLSQGKQNYTNIKQKQTNFDLKLLDYSWKNKDEQKTNYLTREFSFQLEK